MTNSELVRVAVFEGKHIRKIIHADEWWFSIIDIVEVLTGSSISKHYWSDLKRKLAKEGYYELYEKIVQLKFSAADGKFYATDCANTETMFRIIQSIPSPKGESWKTIPQGNSDCPEEDHDLSRILYVHSVWHQALHDKKVPVYARLRS